MITVIFGIIIICGLFSFLDKYYTKEHMKILGQYKLYIDEYEKHMYNIKIVCKCALADLEGIMPEFDPDGEKNHPAWKTIEELKEVTKQ